MSKIIKSIIGVLVILILLTVLILFTTVNSEVTKKDINKLDKRVNRIERKVDRNFEQLLKEEIRSQEILVNQDSIKNNLDTVKAGIRVIGRTL